MRSELHAYVYDELRRGTPRQDIARDLAAARWPKKSVDAALAAYVDGSPYRLPVPVCKPSLSARETLLYLLLFFSLCVCAVATVDVAFKAIDIWATPGPREEWWMPPSFSSPLAALTVGLPIFLWLSRLMSRAYRADPTLRESPVRRWTTYPLLVVTGVAAIGFLIAALERVYAGGATVPGMLRTLVVAAVAGAIYAWYYSDLKREESPAPPAGT